MIWRPTLDFWSLASGHFNPGSLRLLNGVSWKKGCAVEGLGLESLRARKWGQLASGRCEASRQGVFFWGRNPGFYVRGFNLPRASDSRAFVGRVLLYLSVFFLVRWRPAGLFFWLFFLFSALFQVPLWWTVPIGADSKHVPEGWWIRADSRTHLMIGRRFLALLPARWAAIPPLHPSPTCASRSFLGLLFPEA